MIAPSEPNGNGRKPSDSPAPIGAGAIIQSTWETLDSKKKRRYARAIHACNGVVKDAIRKFGINSSTHYRWMASDPHYRLVVDCSKGQVVEQLEDVAVDRAMNGWDEPVYFMGAVCGHKRKFDNKLLLEVLRVADPAKWGRHVDTEPESADRIGDALGYLEGLVRNLQSIRDRRGDAGNGQGGQANGNGHPPAKGS